MSKAVQGSKLQYISPSAIELFLLCARKYVAVYKFGKREPENLEPGAPTNLGTRTHTSMEDFVLKGTEPGYREDGSRLPPDKVNEVIVQSAQLAASYLVDKYDIVPGKPHPGIEIEGYIERNLPGFAIAGTPIHGRVDFADFSNPTHPRILDFKTANGFKHAAKADNSRAAPDKLLRNKAQVVFYVEYAFQRFPEAEEVSMTYLYLNKEGTPEIKEVTAHFTREQSAAAFAKFVPVVDSIQKALRSETLDEVAPNFNSCFAFGKPCHIKSMGLCTKPLFADDDRPASLFNDQEIDVPDTETQTPAPPPGETSSTTPGLVLYVNGNVTKGPPAQLLEDEIARRGNEIAKKDGRSDINDYKFGEGIKQLVSSFRQNPVTGEWSAHTTGISGQVVEVLVPVATKVVRGSL